MKKIHIVRTSIVVIIIMAFVAVLVTYFSFGGNNMKNGKTSVSLDGNTLCISNENLTLCYDLSKGKYDLFFGEIKAVGGAEALTIIDGKTYETSNSARRKFLKTQTQLVEDNFGAGIKAAVDNDFGDIHVIQFFSVYEDKPYILLQTAVTKNEGDISTNHISPMFMKAPKGQFCDIDIGSTSDPRVLFVPFDNDKWVKYEANSYSTAHKSYEVTAIYDALTRQGLVIGSIDHDVWKTAINLQGEKEGLSLLEVYGGASDYETRDQEPHGFVSGSMVWSPRIFLGKFDDYRTGLEEYGKANTLVQPPLKWTGSSIFGWNSWYAASTHIDATTYLNAADFIKNDLQPKGFCDENNVTYINFDSYWTNLDEQQLIDVVKYVHAQGQKAGIYWTPFAYWGNDLMRPVEGNEDGTVYKDILLKDSKGNVLEPLDGGFPIDPTHPAQIKRMEYQINKFIEWGFDFIKLDFLTHGAMEGIHYKKDITTGLQAYNYGMKKLVELLSEKKVGHPFFISASIAPLFPYQYAHARRISCDVFNELKDSEYMLNAMTYGWWQKEFYSFLDGDMVCLHKRDGGVTSKDEEALARVNSIAVTGGLFLLGDNFNAAAKGRIVLEELKGTDEAVERAKRLLTNSSINELIKEKKIFIPAEGNIAQGASDIFVSKGENEAYIAVFNYSLDKPKIMDVNLKRVGLQGDKEYEAVDLWSGQKMKILENLHVELASGQSTIFKLTELTQTSDKHQ